MGVRSARLGVAAALLAAAASSVAQTAAQAPSPTYGREVRSLSYTSDGPVGARQVARLIEIQVGQPLTEEQTGATIRNLFATRQFTDVQVEVRPAGETVDVLVHLFRAFRIKPLRFAGSFPLSRDELRRALPFSEGATFEQSVVDDGAAALKRRMQEEGFLQAQVKPQIRLDRASFDAAVTYRFLIGARARVAPALFDGDVKPFTPEQLLRRAVLKPGKPYSEARARADAARMMKWLHKSSYLKASIELIAAQPADDGRIMPVYRISVGKPVAFETRGVKPSRVQREIHDLIEGQGFDEDLLLQYVADKREALQRKGFYRAKVDYAMVEKPGQTTITITVEQGPHLEVEKVLFSGNASVRSRTLLALMVTHAKGLPLLAPGHLVDRELDDDVAAIRGYYQTRGWIGVKVNKPEVARGSKPNFLVLTIPIEEGPRVIVASRNIVGADHVAPDVLEKQIGVKAGKPFNPDQARQDAYNLAGYYHDHGYKEASVKNAYVLSSDRTSADVTYQVDEGLRSFFGKTIVRGNTRTDAELVLRLVTWREGDPYSETKVAETQRNLARSGVFQRVEIRPEVADPTTQARNIEIELQEGRPLSVLYGVGYQYAPDAVLAQNDPFALAGVSYNNLFGQMLSAGLEGQVAISGRFRLQLSFRDPFLFNRSDYPFTSYLFATREPIQDIDVERLGWVNEVSHYFGKHLRIAVRVEYQRIRPFNPQDLSTIEAENFPRFDQPIEEATTGPNFFYDRRDDILDPHHGYYATGAVKYAFPILNAEARYTRVTGQFASFFSVGPNVIALSARGGGIFPYGPSDIQVPIAERFFDGKNSINRGFDTDLLGIPGQTVDYDTKAVLHTGAGTGSCAGTFPSLAAYDCNAGPRIVGGNGMLSLNAEWRFPIAGPVRGAVFYDASQVWRNFSDVGIRFERNNGLRQSVGIGLRVVLPIGPLRADLGYPLHRRTIPFNVTDSTGAILLPNAGTVRESGHIFVSIGYPF